ncbi:SRPBCC family protein [Stratiformator vulcanicus]|uniref:Polyketide cyclase / dehydrase and lipid transport n=1 Tax=Stratiformator vulcanicus TaxID=2527980 RepID=A0A517QXB9_9PLAN|nr:SRPBCC family protein [Stratiformator vulcanicus]QDT36220.1 Polyketide cyclase / dehydrase and lipid transport [Stratiformator vulcanicus]
MHEFDTSISVAAPIDEVFDFLTRPENVIQVTAPDAGVSVVDAPEVMQPGSRNKLKFSGFGPTQTFIYEVTEFVRPERFVEVLIEGPMKMFRNEHEFESHGSDGTSVRDRIVFQPPGGLIGMVVNEKLIRSQLEKGFRFRHAQLQRLFGTA